MMRTQFTLVGLVACLLAFASCGKSGGADPATIGEWSGKGPSQSPTFTVRRDSWVLEWQQDWGVSDMQVHDPDVYEQYRPAGAVFSVDVHRAGTDARHHAGTTPPYPMTGQSIVQGSGEFYLKVNASPNQAWSVSAKPAP